MSAESEHRYCSACGQLNHDEEDGVFDCGHSREVHGAYLAYLVDLVELLELQAEA